MKKQFFILALLLTLGSIVSSFKNDEVKYDILSDYSNIVWFLSTNHYINSGSMKVKDGYIVVQNGKISSGKINIDVASITNTNLKDLNKKNSLISFLKSDKFFDVNKYPTITIDILSSHPTTDNQCLLKTNLTIKGITIPIEFSTMIKNQTKNAILIETCRIHIIKENFKLLYNDASIPADLVQAISPDANLELEISQLVGKARN